MLKDFLRSLNLQELLIFGKFANSSSLKHAISEIVKKIVFYTTNHFPIEEVMKILNYSIFANIIMHQLHWPRAFDFNCSQDFPKKSTMDILTFTNRT